MKKIGIILRLILNFSIISIISIFFIFLLYNIYTRGEGKVYDLIVYLFSSLIIYKNFIPFIIALSVYSAFFRGYYLPGLSISRIIAIPIALIVVLTAFYTFYDYFLTDKIIYELRDYNLGKDYIYFNQYKTSLKENEYQRAKQEFDAGNLDNAEIFARNALIYDRNDGNILLLLKDIENKRIELEEIQNTDRATYVNNLLSQGSRAYSLSNYTLASRYYNDVLKIDRYNPLAIYYLNKISIIQNDKPIYIRNNFYESLVYGKLADTIELYRNGNFWRAYSSISNLFINYPDINEIGVYYSLILDSIDKYDFFIDRAKDIRNFFIDDYYSTTNTTMLENNGVTLMLNNNTTMLCALYSIFFGESLYLYDISVIDLDKDLKITNQVIYKYGKISSSFNDPDIKNIILKAKFNAKNETYDNNNTNEYIIPINISDNTIKNIKDYPYRVLGDTGIKGIISLKSELPLFGYSNERTTNVLFKKILSPFYYLILFIAIAYLSFRYNIYTRNSSGAFLATLIGIIGSILIVLLYNIFLNYVSTHMLAILGFNVSIIIMLVVAVVMILALLLQMSRINKYVK